MIGDMLLYTSTYFGLFLAIFFLLTLFENKEKLKDKIPKRFPSITIIIPAYNEEKTIEATLRAALAADYPKKRLKVFVVDDGSTDNTYNLAKQFESPRLEVFTKRNEGKGATMNFGLSKCRTELVASLDADSLISEDALKKMVGYFEDPQIMAVIPSLKVYTTNKMNLLQKIQAIEYILGVFLRKIFGFMGAIYVTPGPLSIYRKSFFDRHGGYDENNMTEDIEVALRMQSLHYKIDNVPDAEVRTIVPESFIPLLKQRLRWFAGFIENIWEYRRLFGIKYGDLGFFFLPSAIMSITLLVLLTFYFFSGMLTTALKNFFNFQAINFDILTLIKTFRFDSFFISTKPIMLFSVLALIAAILIVNVAKIISKEKQSIKQSYLLYILLYWPLFTFWWVGASLIVVMRRKVGWRTK